MKKNKTLLISAILFLSYDIYVLIKTIIYYSQPQIYGDVYFEFMFIPHIVFITLGTIFNFITYFKDKKILKIITLILYLIGIIFLFINR